MTHLHLRSRTRMLTERFRGSHVSRARMAVRHRQDGIDELRVTEETHQSGCTAYAMCEKNFCKTIAKKARKVMNAQVTHTTTLPDAFRRKMQQLSRDYGEMDFGRKMSSSLT